MGFASPCNPPPSSCLLLHFVGTQACLRELQEGILSPAYKMPISDCDL